MRITNKDIRTIDDLLILPEYSGAFSITSPALGNHDSGEWKSANTWYSMCLDLSRLQAPPVAARP